VVRKVPLGNRVFPLVFCKIRRGRCMVLAWGELVS
jgi:hypothetical protein